ncbi:hypothetical protein AVEN_148311-1 [Araneus ventricosus]|uniref:Uncharacterized protein n=1 Tax=Araneus ventricosus TaxID=182803 RepID=A0A4Y2DJ56_ARAVE|nr:hypothetical protein AVEN_148311-1 [Araneus ventricosus]
MPDLRFAVCVASFESPCVYFFTLNELICLFNPPQVEAADQGCDPGQRLPSAPGHLLPGEGDRGLHVLEEGTRRFPRHSGRRTRKAPLRIGRYVYPRKQLCELATFFLRETISGLKYSDISWAVHMFLPQSKSVANDLSDAFA